MGLHTVVFGATGAGPQTVVIPSTYLPGTFTFDIRGAQGGNGAINTGVAGGFAQGGVGGKGSRSSGTYPVNVGDTINAYVGVAGVSIVTNISTGGAGGYGYVKGGNGANGNASNGRGGGGGGGSSALFDGAQFIIEVAGGGGGGGPCLLSHSGAGGGYGSPNSGQVGYIGGSNNGVSAQGGHPGVYSGTYGAGGAGGIQAAGNGVAGGAATSANGGPGGAGNATAGFGGGGGGGGGGAQFGGGGGGGGGYGQGGAGGGGGASTARSAIAGFGTANLANYQAGNGQITVTWRQAPTATPTAPTGTITATSEPLLAATFTSPDNYGQQAYQVAVYVTRAFPAGFNPATGHYTGDGGVAIPQIWYSGTVYSAIPGVNIEPPILLPNGLLTAFFAVLDANGNNSNWSPWASTSWTQNAPGAAAPTLSVASSAPTARNTLTITPPVLTGGPAGISWFHAQRSPDGVNWVEMVGGQPIANLGNLLSPDDASFEGISGTGNAGSWQVTDVGGTPTAAVATLHVSQGTHSLQIGGTTEPWSASPAAFYPVLPNLPYAFMVGLGFASISMPSTSLLVTWYAADGATAISTVTVATGTVSTSAFTTLSGVVFAPSTAGFVDITVVSTTAGTCYLDGNGMWQAAAVPAWSMGGPAVTFADRGAGREQTTYYRAQAIFGASGLNLAGTWSSTASTYLASDGNDWLICPVSLSLDGVINYQGTDIASVSHEDQMQYQPEGRPDFVVFHGTLHYDSFVIGIASKMLTFLFPNDAAYDNWVAIRNLQLPCLLKTVYGDTGLDQFWIVIGPDVSTSRFGGGIRAEKGPLRDPQIRTVTCSVYQTTEPVGLPVGP